MTTRFTDIKISPSMPIDPRHFEELFMQYQPGSYREPTPTDIPHSALMEEYIRCCDLVDNLGTEYKEKIYEKHHILISEFDEKFADYHIKGILPREDIPLLIRFLIEVCMDFLRATDKLSAREIAFKTDMLRSLEGGCVKDCSSCLCQ